MMTISEAREAATRLHMQIERRLSDADLVKVENFLRELADTAYKEGESVRPAPNKIREIVGLPKGRAWLIG